jgi:hypothetical protein
MTNSCEFVASGFVVFLACGIKSSPLVVEHIAFGKYQKAAMLLGVEHCRL